MHSAQRTAREVSGLQRSDAQYHREPVVNEINTLDIRILMSRVFWRLSMNLFQWLFGKKKQHPLTEGVCPDCQNTTFYFGPKGGMCQNIKCAKCAAKFNVAPFEDGWLGEPFLIERI